ncbi:hypothetical protein C8Q80DRAFT_1122252 [Daedaleopsis nitida]|nr:hypothetical protein C8Q80DRAFT_1122252 [Daedaleopsis nitida]
MLVTSLLITCLVAFMSALHGLSVIGPAVSWLSQPTLSPRTSAIGLNSPPVHLFLDPAPPPSDNWRLAPSTNGTLDLMRTYSATLIRLARGTEHTIPVIHPRHSVRITVLVLACIGFCAGIVSFAGFLIIKPSRKTNSARPRLLPDHTYSQPPRTSLPRRSPRRHGKKAKLDHSLLCPQFLPSREPVGNPAITFHPPSPGFSASHPERPNLRTAIPISNAGWPRAGSAHRVFGVDIPLPLEVPQLGRESLDDIDDGSYLRAALGLTDWSEIPPLSGYWPMVSNPATLPVYFLTVMTHRPVASSSTMTSLGPNSTTDAVGAQGGTYPTTNSTHGHFPAATPADRTRTGRWSREKPDSDRLSRASDLLYVATADVGKRKILSAPRAKIQSVQSAWTLDSPGPVKSPQVQLSVRIRTSGCSPRPQAVSWTPLYRAVFHIVVAADINSSPHSIKGFIYRSVLAAAARARPQTGETKHLRDLW